MLTLSTYGTSGVAEVAVALRKGSGSAKKAANEKLKVLEVAEAAKWADVVMMLTTPDELQAEIYRDHLHANMREGSALLFAHGLNVHFNLIETARGSRCWHGRAEGTGAYCAIGICARCGRAMSDRNCERRERQRP